MARRYHQRLPVDKRDPDAGYRAWKRYETARRIALHLLTGGNLPDESRVRAAAETAVRAIDDFEPGHAVDIETLVRDLGANLNQELVYDAATNSWVVVVRVGRRVVEVGVVVAE